MLGGCTAYSMAKFAMSLATVGLAGELKGKVGVNGASRLFSLLSPPNETRADKESVSQHSGPSPTSQPKRSASSSAQKAATAPRATRQSSQTQHSQCWKKTGGITRAQFLSVTVVR